MIEKQTVEYKKLRVRLEGVQKERDDAREELTRKLGDRGSLVSGISQENGRMILKRALEICTCKAGQGHQLTPAYSDVEPGP